MSYSEKVRQFLKSYERLMEHGLQTSVKKRDQIGERIAAERLVDIRQARSHLELSTLSMVDDYRVEDYEFCADADGSCRLGQFFKAPIEELREAVLRVYGPDHVGPITNAGMLKRFKMSKEPCKNESADSTKKEG